ncbi:MAG: hypothetical protein ABIK23_02730 [candidate division WOR-3 bacterium]
MFKHKIIAVLLSALFVSFILPVQAGYLYISDNILPDSINPVEIIETDVPLDPIPPAFSPTTIEAIHSMLLLTPTEAREQAESRSGPIEEIFGSFIHTWIGPTKDTAIDDGQSAPLFKWVECGGWTRSRSTPEDTAIGVRLQTRRNGQVIPPQWTPWRVIHVPGPFVEVVAARVWCYNLNKVIWWEQYSEHAWWWNGGSDSTYSGTQVRF